MEDIVIQIMEGFIARTEIEIPDDQVLITEFCNDS